MAYSVLSAFPSTLSQAQVFHLQTRRRSAMKEICWQTFLKFPIEVQNNIIAHALGPLPAAVWSSYHKEDSMRKMLNEKPVLLVRFHTAVLETVKQKLGPDSATLLREAMVDA